MITRLNCGTMTRGRAYSAAAAGLDPTFVEPSLRHTQLAKRHGADGFHLGRLPLDGRNIDNDRGHLERDSAADPARGEADPFQTVGPRVRTSRPCGGILTAAWSRHTTGAACRVTALPSALGGRAVAPATWLELRFLAISRLSRPAQRRGFYRP